MNGFGRQVGGAASVVLGVFIICWGDFVVPWEFVPVQPPLREWLAYIAGAIIVLAGAGLFWRRVSTQAALVLAGIAAVFTVLWLIKASAAPGTYDPWSNVAEESSIAAGYLALIACLAPVKTENVARLALATRIWFGACSLSFGVVHFTAFKISQTIVPPWLPFSASFWVVATGVAHLAAGIAILSGIWALTAARMAALMYVGFILLGWSRGVLMFGTLAPKIVHYISGGMVISTMLAAAAWMVGDCIAAYPPVDGRLFEPRRRA